MADFLRAPYRRGRFFTVLFAGLFSVAAIAGNVWFWDEQQQNAHLHHTALKAKVNDLDAELGRFRTLSRVVATPNKNVEQPIDLGQMLLASSALSARANWLSMLDQIDLPETWLSDIDIGEDRSLELVGKTLSENDFNRWLASLVVLAARENFKLSHFSLNKEPLSKRRYRFNVVFTPSLKS